MCGGEGRKGAMRVALAMQYCGYQVSQTLHHTQREVVRHTNASCAQCPVNTRRGKAIDRKYIIGFCLGYLLQPKKKEIRKSAERTNAIAG